jgi:phosphatidylglycerophosphate synthase
VLRWLPNLLTASRGLAGFVVAGLLWFGPHNVVAFWVFIAAMLTDLVDGWLAKRLNAVSSFGQALDAISDKLLTDVTWITLWLMGWAPGWLAGTMLARDLLVVVGWTAARLTGRRWQASLVARVAISLEGTTLPFLLLHDRLWDVHWYTAGVLLGGLTLALSAASAVEYVVRGPEPVTDAR